jgi:hypothetical protein
LNNSNLFSKEKDEKKFETKSYLQKRKKKIILILLVRSSSFYSVAKSKIESSRKKKINKHKQF